jgi:hypothetical protein
LSTAALTDETPLPNSAGRKKFFFEEKNQKTFIRFGFGLTV